MSVRNALLVLGLSTAAAVGTVTAPAGASLADSAAVSTTIATNSVAPVTNLVGNLACTSPTSTMSATWTRSTSARVTGYVLRVHWSDGALDEVPLGPTASSWTQPINKYFVTAYAVRYSVTTVTDYGWTKATAQTAAFQC